MIKYSVIIPKIAILCALTVAITSCTSVYPDEQYWQRTNTSQLAFMRGPKANQILQQNIRNCVNELEELERLNEIENPIQKSYNDRIIPTDPMALEGDNNTALLAGQYSYKNFDGCMYAKGWERTQFVPYNDRITADDLRLRRASPK